MTDYKCPSFIYFDLGKVLVEFDHALAVKQLSELTGCSVEMIHHTIFETTWPPKYERGLIDTREFCQQFRDATESNAGDSAICLAMSRIFKPNAEIVSLVTAVQASKIPLGILSNTFDAHWQFLTSNRYAILNLFPIHALSFRLGTAKPEPEIYRLAAEMAGVEPSEIFFTDDMESNIEAACSAGYDAVLYQGADHLADQLRRRGLRFNY